MYKFQDDYYGEDYYGEGETEDVDAAEEEEEEYDAEEDDAELAEDEEAEGGLGAIALAWGLVPVVDIALGVFFMGKTKDLNNSAWKNAYTVDLAVGGVALVTYLGALLDMPALFIYGTYLNILGEAANLYLIYAANKDLVVDAAKPLYGYIGHSLNLILSLAVAAGGSGSSEVEEEDGEDSEDDEDDEDDEEDEEDEDDEDDEEDEEDAEDDEDAEADDEEYY